MKQVVIIFSMIFGFFASEPLAAQAYQIGHVQITYQDPARGMRNIQTEIYYPAATAGTGVAVSPGAFPVIVFGHGFVMAWDAYQNIWEDLVPLGYIVAFPRTEGSISPNHGDFGLDLAFLVGKLQSESASNSSSPFYNHINSKSAIMGHSMGGGATFLAGAYNTSITTMVTLAAANTTPSSITAASHVTVPNLVFSGQNDCVAPAATNQQMMYDSLAAACKTFISVLGGAHCEFANYNFNCSFGESTCSPSPTISAATQQDIVSDFLHPWLAYYLKDDCAALDIFNDSLSASSRISYQSQCVISNPVASASGMVLSSTPASTYQWYLDGNPVAGATSQVYTATAAGTYQVMVTYYNSCLYPSNTLVLSTTGIQEPALESILLSPNPVSDRLKIKITGNGDALISIYDLLGKVVYSGAMKDLNRQGQESELSMDAVVPGVYFVEVSCGTSVLRQKLIKQ